MSNMIRFKKEKISMSNQGTDCFLELLLIASDTFEKTAQQEKLIAFLKEQKDINTISPGTVSFDIDEMPWSKDTLSKDILFMMEVIKKAKSEDVLNKLDYRPNTEIVFPWLDQFSMMIWKLDKKYLYGIEEVEIVKGGVGPIYKILIGEDNDAKRRLLFYLDWYLDPYYENDLNQLYEPIKEMLQDIVLKDNEEDIKEEALHLLEAYTDAPYELFEENINRIPTQYLSDVKSLIKKGEAEKIELTGTFTQRIEEAVCLVLSEVSQEEVDKFCELYKAANITLLPSAIDFFKKYGGAFRDSYIELNEPQYNNDLFLDCYGIPYIRYTGTNPKGKFQEQLRELEWAKNAMEDVKEFAQQEVCPIAEIGYYFQPDVYIGEDGTLYCVYEYKEEIGVFHTPEEILEDQLGNIYPVAVYKYNEKDRGIGE